MEPIQTRPHFVVRTSCRGKATRMPWPLPHQMLIERIPQTFFVVWRIAPSALAREQKTWISSARAINKQVIRRTSPASGQRTLGKWCPMKSAATTHCLYSLPNIVAKEHWGNGVQRRVWQQLTALAVRNCLYSLPNIALALDIWY